MFLFSHLRASFCPTTEKVFAHKKIQGLVLEAGGRPEIKFVSIKLKGHFEGGGAEQLAPPCSTEELDCSQIRASRSGRDLTLKESEVTGGEYEMSLVLVRGTSSRARSLTDEWHDEHE